MFFSGDPSTRKRIDLGGRSSKERDRKNLLEQTRLERNRRMWLRQQNSAAIKIQKCYRGRKVVRNEQSKLREKCHKIYGKYCQNLDRSAFGPDSDFLRQFLFFFNAENNDDVLALVNICRLLQQFVQQSGDVVRLFSGLDYSSTCPLVNYRVKQLVYTCIRALHQNRNQLKDQFLLVPEESSVTAIPLLEVLVLLIDIKLPWSCKIVGHMFQNNAFGLLREIILTAKDDVDNRIYPAKGSSLERVLTVVMCHIGQKPCICSYFDPRYDFSSQILTIPFLWNAFPDLRQVYATQGLNQHYVHQMATLVPDLINFLPKDISDEIPTYACLLGNILETAGIALSQPDCSFDMAMDLAAIATFLLESHPSLKLLNKKENSVTREDDTGDDEVMEVALDRKLEQQICNAIDTRFLLQLTNILFRDISSVNGSDYGPDDREVAAVGAICGFLYVIFNTLPLERIMTVLAYRTELVPMLWKFMKQCHENKQRLSLSEWLSYLSGDAPGWLLPLAVFCPVYKHMLMIVDNEEFYEQGKPLSLEDIRSLIILLKQVLWQLLWVNHTSSATPVKSVPVTTVSKRQSIEAIQQRVSIVVSELLSQLQDWNNRRQFTSPTDFHADGVNDSFISQALMEKTRANEVLKQAALLIPFTSRVKIFTSQLADVRQQHGSQALFTRNRFRIRRDHILEDAYNQMSQLSEDDLQGLIRVSFVNEFGVEEAGIDGGGIFKDFMENITRAAFDVQYGLFKETADHQLYPNPGSGMIHEQHLQFFHFLGTLLAKAMFEGILVDLPFATFFLSKLKQKHNYLNDLPSLDPELYRHLIFLKHYEGNISELELYFVIVNNEYGEQTEEELLPGGKNKRVTNENVITFIHLVANHRLNSQIRQQSSHFLRGFQQLIQKDWIDMFNEQELQLLISGSLDSLDVDDLRLHTNYAGGYHSEHYVIEMFWEVLKGFSTENKKKFLKFVTGCSRGPLLGFRYLEPLFCIQRAGGNAIDEALDRLPTSATCMNLLKLPPYTSKEQMETKLLYAINAEAGFDLS
ncbi:hypothetical protein HN51_065436 [Arachis hypogaea]|uniref:E3 ubiquitin-protein ligase UPL6 n=1 Tax=Arachis ipaensis TaxID=130454 RepID=UPI0007AEEF90|nr:E3 ubiquitin-protein ligase UPL6 [Arachis ipaensis]XP_025646408.1 E3 ubiquitin-protein ligase UPL6 [Arachis hypogaea]QHO06575.1 E3 ubiquitin-protein ligase [Arachis hypogaea]